LYIKIITILNNNWYLTFRRCRLPIILRVKKYDKLIDHSEVSRVFSSHWWKWVCSPTIQFQ